MIEYSSNSDSEDFEWKSNLECRVNINPLSRSNSDFESTALLKPSSKASFTAPSKDLSKAPSSIPSNFREPS
jgi:hypothetical protein